MDFFAELVGKLTEENWQREHSRAILMLEEPTDDVGTDGRRVLLEHSPRHYRGPTLTMEIQKRIVYKPPGEARYAHESPMWTAICQDGRIMRWESFDLDRTQASLMWKLWNMACKNRANADARAALTLLG